MGLVQAARTLGPAGGLGIVRLTAMAVTLGAVTLTYRVLSPAHFALFNLATFLVAISSALTAPVNRAYWAEHKASNYAPAATASMASAVLVIAAGSAIGWWTNRITFPPVVIFAASACIYTAGKVIERYSYSHFLMLDRPALSALPLVLFALGEIAAALLIWFGHLDALGVRLAVPGIMIIAVLGASPHRYLIQEFLCGLIRPRGVASFAREHIASSLGLRVVTLYVLLTSAGNLERLLVTYFGLAHNSVAVAYLLALSYTVAFQTLASLTFDLARTKVFHNGAWQLGARQFSKITMASLIAMVTLAAAAYPLLVWTTLLPAIIHPLLWMGLLVRALALVLISLLSVDRFQEGRLGGMFFGYGAILAGVIAAFALFKYGQSQETVGLVLTGAALLPVIVMSSAFYNRVPR